LIDRIGRCIVKCSGYQNCQEIKKAAEKRSSRRGGRALKIMIMHSVN
jgi:E3 ubiquitin-protein ligase UBR2